VIKQTTKSGKVYDQSIDSTFIVRWVGKSGAKHRFS
jgi:hypothetical protein